MLGKVVSLCGCGHQSTDTDSSIKRHLFLVAKVFFKQVKTTTELFL